MEKKTILWSAKQIRVFPLSRKDWKLEQMRLERYPNGFSTKKDRAKAVEKNEQRKKSGHPIKHIDLTKRQTVISEIKKS